MAHRTRSTSRSQAPAQAVITDAAHPRSLDVDARQRRYLWTMLLRVVCFALVPFVPGLWGKAACIVGAALLPAVAVLLANAADNHKPPQAPEHEPTTVHAALPAGEIVPGHVVDG